MKQTEFKKTDYKNYWVFLEHEKGEVLPVSLELLSEARKLCDCAGEQLTAVYIGSLSDKSMEKVLAAGVDQLLRVTGTGYIPFSVDAYTHCLTVLCEKHRPSAVLVGGTINGRDFAPRFACRLLTGCTSDATELIYNPDSGDIEFVEPAVGGKMMAVITIPVCRPQVGTIRPGTFKYIPQGKKDQVTEIEEHINFNPPELRTQILDYIPDSFDSEYLLSEADYIVCVGRAVKQESLEKYRTLAQLLGGKLACTRPVSESNMLPSQLVIGQSGQSVHPKIYFGFGVSGAINHITGIRDSKKIVAVNTDPEAAIFNYCDYGIVGDMDEVCDELIAKLKSR